MNKMKKKENEKDYCENRSCNVGAASLQSSADLKILFCILFYNNKN